MSIALLKLGALHVELTPADVEPRREQRHLVLRALHDGVGAHLRDFLLRLRELRLRRLEPLFLLALIELDDDIALLHGRSGGGDGEDLHRAADRRRHERLRLQRPELACRVHHDRHVALGDARRRNDVAVGLHALHRGRDESRR